MNDAIGLTAYPLSSRFTESLARRAGCGVRVVALSELRRSTVFDLWRSLRGLQAEQGFVLLEQPDAAPLLPVLELLLALTRCRRLAVLGASGPPRSFSRVAGLASVLRIAGGTLAGAAGAARSAWQLLRLPTEAGPLRRVTPGAARVAYLKTTLWFGLKAGGSVGHVAGVVNALARRGAGPHVFAVERPPMIDAAVPVTEVRNAGSYGYPYELSYYAYEHRFVRAVRDALRSSPPDLLYHRLSLANHAGVALAKATGVPLVTEYNGSEVWVAKHWGRPLRFPRLATWAEQRSLVGSDLVVTVSEVLGQELVERGVPPERVLVHPNCVDIAQFDPGRFSGAEVAALRASLDTDARATVCTFIGTFGKWHGVVFLAETIARLARTDPGWLDRHRVVFLFVGDGQYMGEVRRVVAEAGADRWTRFAGLVEQAEAPRYLAASDVLLSPHVANADGSRFFGSPTKLFEYMAMARGIAASALEQQGRILDPAVSADLLPPGEPGPGETAVAVHFQPGDPAGFERALRFLVERPAWRGVLGANARRLVSERYTWEHNVDAVLRRLADLRRSGRPEPR